MKGSGQRQGASRSGGWLFSPAKVNLYLKILGRRADGYHLLDTLIAPITLGDRVGLEPHPNNGRWQVDCPGFAELENENNLCLRAARALRPYCSGTEPLFEGTIHLEKKIPLGAGLGGGSSNAAAVIKLILQQYSMSIDKPELFALAAKLGGDVPVFLRDGAWTMGGIGDRFEAAVSLPEAGLLLLYPGIGVSSAAAYLAYDRQNFPLTSREANGTRRGPWPTAYDLGKIMENDLEPVVAANYDEVAKARQLLRGSEALQVMMSGSGSTVYGLFSSLQEAQAAAGRLTLPPKWRSYCAGFKRD